MAELAESFGIGFAQKYPALSTKLASNTAGKTGLAPSDPGNIAAAMHSKVFNTEAGKAAQATDPSVIDKVFNPPDLAPDTASQEVQTEAAFGAQEQNLSNVVGAKQALFKGSQEATAELARLSSFNKEEHKAKRLKELDPVSGIDERMLQLRMQAFTAQSLLETDPEIMALPPALQQRAMASKMQVFSNSIQDLTKVRTSRLASAEAQIDKEFSANENQINTAQSRIDGIDSQIEQLESIGGDQDNIAQLRLDRIKERERLAKIRSKAGGISTQQESVYQALFDDFMESHGNRPPTEREERILRGDAADIVKNNPDIAKNPRARVIQPVPGGDGDLQNEGILKARGFGLPVSADEGVEIRASRLDLIKKLRAAGENAQADQIQATLQ